MQKGKEFLTNELVTAKEKNKPLFNQKQALCFLKRDFKRMTQHLFSAPSLANKKNKSALSDKQNFKSKIRGKAL